MQNPVVTLFLLLLLWLPTAGGRALANSLAGPVRSTGKLPFVMDVYQAQGSEGKTDLTVAYALNTADLPADGEGELAFAVSFLLTTPAGDSLAAWREIKRLGRAAQGNEQQTFVDQRRFALEMDSVVVGIRIKDVSGEPLGEVRTMVVPETFGAGFSIGDPVYIRSVRKSEQPGVFTRQGVDLIPNVGRVFDNPGDGGKILIYYEMNNLSGGAEQRFNYRVRCSLENLQGEETAVVDHPVLSASAANSSRLEKIALGGVGTGLYHLKLRVVDLQSEQQVVKSGYVYVQGDSEWEDLLPMDSAHVRTYLSQIRYIASDAEIEVFKDLDKVARQRFLVNFWKGRDPDPLTRENEFMIEHFRRLAFCRNYLSGIENDRARVLITYGDPLEVERMASDQTFRYPVEIWTYGGSGNIQFVFADRGGVGYVLVHTNHPDEDYNNPDWRELMGIDRDETPRDRR